MTSADAPRSLEELGAIVLRAREAKGWGRRQAANDPNGPNSPFTWKNVEEGKPVQTLTYAGIERVFGWPVGSILSYLRGGPEPSAPASESSDLNEETERRARPEAPRTINEVLQHATYDQLLDALRERHEADRAELSRRLYPLLAEEETAESVRARGMIPGRPIRDGGQGSANDDAAGGQ